MLWRRLSSFGFQWKSDAWKEKDSSTRTNLMGYPKTMVAVSWLTCASQDVCACMALHVLSVGMAQVRAPWLDSREDVIFTCINLGMQVEGKADVFTGFLWWLTLFTLGGVQSQLSLAAGTDLILYLPRTWHPMFDPDLRVELVGDAWQCSHLLHPESLRAGGWRW